MSNTPRMLHIDAVIPHIWRGRAVLDADERLPVAIPKIKPRCRASTLYFIGPAKLIGKVFHF